MNKKHSAFIDKFKLPILLVIFVFALSLRVSTLNQIGQTWDEYLYVSQGYKMGELIKKGEFDSPFFIETYDHPPLVKYLYGLTASYDLESNKNSQLIFNQDYTYSRLLSALMFSLGVVIVVLIAWKLFSPSVGIISGIILAMLPFSLGLSQLVSAESLKILTYPLAILTYIWLIERFSWKRVLLAGIATGIALQAKQSNALLFLILGLIFYLQYRGLKLNERPIFLKTRIKGFVLIIAVSIVTFLLIWPQAVFNISEIQEINQKLWSVKFSIKPWQITLSPPEIFFGHLILTPIFYYAVYFFISIPVLVLILFFIGINKVLKSRNLYNYLILLWFIVPFIMSFYSWRQHGLRYIIEIYPAIAIISAVGFDAAVSKLTKNNDKKFLFFIPVFIYLFIVLIQIKPYYLDYFNELVGGTGNVWKHNLFQTGWWGQGIREAGLYLKKVPSGSDIGLAISPDHTIPKFDNLKYSEWEEMKKYDYVVVNHYHIIRDGFDDSAIKRDYKLVYEVKAAGATLVYVYAKR